MWMNSFKRRSWAGDFFFYSKLIKKFPYGHVGTKKEIKSISLWNQLEQFCGNSGGFVELLSCLASSDSQRSAARSGEFPTECKSLFVFFHSSLSSPVCTSAIRLHSVCLLVFLKRQENKYKHSIQWLMSKRILFVYIVYIELHFHIIKATFPTLLKRQY